MSTMDYLDFDIFYKQVKRNRMKCKCDMRTKLIGDGCSICNPEYYLEVLSDQLNDLKDEKFTMSMFSSSAELYKAKIERLSDVIQTQDGIIECQSRLLAKRVKG